MPASKTFFDNGNTAKREWTNDCEQMFALAYPIEKRIDSNESMWNDPQMVCQLGL